MAAVEENTQFNSTAWSTSVGIYCGSNKNNTGKKPKLL